MRTNLTHQAPSPAGLLHEIEFSTRQYRELADITYRLSGIHLGHGKKGLLRARLGKRMRALGITSFSDYIKLLKADDAGTELISFLDCITTNKTDFFREVMHFNYLADEILPELDRICPPQKPLNFWSAACSTGEEPYTLAMVLMENQALWRERGAKIQASDISAKVLEKANRGVYSADRIADLPRNILTSYFQKGSGRWTGYVRLKKEIRAMVNFHRINLIEPFAFKEPFHAIFCRNVMIYFDTPTRENLIQRLTQVLVPGGYLFVGHSESLTGIKHDLSFVRPSLYQKAS